MYLLIRRDIVLKDGQVKFFNYAKGFGFIKCEGEDYFVHVTNIEDSDLLIEDEPVSFKAVEGHKGLQAIEIHRKDPPQLVEQSGVVKFYNDDRGFGFIEREGMADVFAHFTDICHGHRNGGLREGSEVKFLVRRGRDGRDRAYKIRYVEGGKDEPS